MMPALSLDRKEAAYRRALTQLRLIFEKSAMPRSLCKHGLQVIDNAFQRAAEIDKSRVTHR